MQSFSILQMGRGSALNKRLFACFLLYHYTLSYVFLYDDNNNWLHRTSPFLREYIFQKLLLACTFSCINKICDGYFWPHCCMNTLYISHTIRSLYAPTHNFSAIRSTLISLFKVTSWFDTVNNAVTQWMNFRENHLHEHDLQLFDYNI